MLNRLPEREQDQDLDRQDFEERCVFNEVILQLYVKLDLAIHRNYHAATSYEHDLHISARNSPNAIKESKPKNAQRPDA